MSSSLKRRLLVIVILSASALLPTAVLALEKTDFIDTNRPSFMFSPLVVPQASVQLENGTLYQHLQHGGTYYDISETQVRLGLTGRTEFQMFVPSFVLLRQAHAPATTAGASDLTEVGFKHQFPTVKKFQITFIGAMNLPTGSKTISGSGVEPVFRMPWAYPIKGGWQIMGMQSLLLLNSGGALEYEPDFMLSKSFGPRAGLFAEYGGFFTQGRAGLSIAHFGAVYRPARHHQLDVQCGFGLNKSAPAAFVGAGYSYRFDHLPW